MSKDQMTSKERVLAALRREIPDRVPWMEGIVDDALATKIVGEPIRVNWDIVLAGILPGGGTPHPERGRRRPAASSDHPQ